MLLLINGEQRELPQGTMVAGVVESMRGHPDARGVAVAVDGEVVPRSSWDATELSAGAHVEIVVAVQGG